VVGRLDQFAKQTFAEETPTATHNALAFEVPPETPLTHVRADGLLRVRVAAAVGSLPLPWSLAEGHSLVCVELKMQGDHVAFRMVQRALLRRQALEVLRADREPTRSWADVIPLWIVTATLPSWVSTLYPLTSLGPGLWSVGTSPPLVWVASNDLELRDDLVPFLVSRTGEALAAFARWVVTRRSPHWVLDMLQILPMPPHPLSELLSIIPDPTDDPEIQERRNMIARAWLDVVSPTVKQEVLDQGLAPLRHLFERKLGRPLTETERQGLVSRLGEVGPDALGDVVLDLGREALEAWLSSPARG
jgi:hypothetical protein